MSKQAERAEDSDDDGTEDEIGVIESRSAGKENKGKKTETGKTRGRPPGTTTSGTRGKKAAAVPLPVESASEDDDDDDDELAFVGEVPKKRGRPKSKPVETDTKPAAAPRGRGRPKAAAATPAKKTDSSKGTSGRKKTRAQTAVEESAPKQITITTGSSVMRSNILRGPAKKKTVTFKDGSDSEIDEEEEPLPTPPPARRRRATGAQDGFGAKPVRKPATGTGAGRGRKPGSTNKKDEPKPLSPKKAGQVAKGNGNPSYNSDDEEDELCGAKDQVKFVVESPSKHGSKSPGSGSPVRRITLTPKKPAKDVDENGEPTFNPAKSINFSDSVYMSSPARRPTASPFQFTMRETPRRGALSNAREGPAMSQPKLSPIQASPLKTSPKKGILGASAKAPSQPNFEPPQSPLKASPKKAGNLGTSTSSASFSMPAPNADAGPASPLKNSPKKGKLGASFAESPTKSSSTPFASRSLIQSPAKKIVSPLKSLSTSSNRPVGTPLQLKPQTRVSPAASPEKTLNLKDVEVRVGEEGANRPSTPLPMTELHSDAEEEGEDAIDDQTINIDGGLGIEIEESAEEDTHAGHAAQAGVDDGDETETDPDMVDDEPENQSDDDVFGPVEADADRNADYAAFDCSHLQADVQAGIDEYQNQPTRSPEVERIGPSENDSEEETGDLTESEDELTQVVQPRFTPRKTGETLKESFPAEIEDVFVDSPVKRGNVGANDVQDTGSPERLEESDLEIPAAESEDEQDIEDGNNTVNGEVEETEENHEHFGKVALEVPAEFDDGQDSEDDEAMHTAFDEFVPVSPYQFREPTESTPALENVPRIPPPVPCPPVHSAVESPSDTPRLEGRHSMESHNAESVAESTMKATQHFEPTIDIGEHFHRMEVPTGETVQTPVKEHHPKHRRSTMRKSVRFTPLANQLSQWKASSPEKSHQERPRRRGVFSLAGNIKPFSEVADEADEVSYPDISEHELADTQSLFAELPQSRESYAPSMTSASEIFEDQEQEREPVTPQEPTLNFAAMERQPMVEITSSPERGIAEVVNDEQATPRQSVRAVDSEETPTQETVHLEEEPEKTGEKENSPAPSLPPMTPTNKRIERMQTVHTTSKVPLRPEGNVSPLKVPKKRGHSLSNASPSRASPRKRKSIFSKNDDAQLQSPRKMPRLEPTSQRSTRVLRDEPTVASSASPAKSPGRNISACGKVLQGAVVHVDVHTTEGEDASGIFIELLQQMGARCVKNWAWNPRSSSSPVDGTDPRDSKVGITHVVFKDGGVRTLEKVREAGGLVRCVGVGWVLE